MYWSVNHIKVLFIKYAHIHNRECIAHLKFWEKRDINDTPSNAVLQFKSLPTVSSLIFLDTYLLIFVSTIRTSKREKFKFSSKQCVWNGGADINRYSIIYIAIFFFCGDTKIYLLKSNNVLISFDLSESNIKFHY